MTRAPTDRSHLSIGEVLSLLQEEFPDVTISKIRFLESQGLLDPERTPSGYRKFYEADIDRLRWILRQQKEHYLPLKVIKDRLDARHQPVPAASGGLANNGGGAVAAHGPPETEDHPGPPASPATAIAVEERPGAARPPGDAPTPTQAPTQAPTRAPTRAPAPMGAPPNASAAAASPASPAPVTAGPHAPAPARSQGSVQAAQADGAPGFEASPAAGSPEAGADAPMTTFTAEQLARYSGLSVRDLRDLERYGLIESSAVGDDAYDADALVIAQTAAGFLQHGIEARHMRTYKVAVDREAGLFEQIVLPLLKQRNPEARQRARETVAELVRLGQQMRGVLLARELRNVAGTA